MRRVLDAGLARHVGVSNYSLGRWRAAERALGRSVHIEPGAVQPASPAARSGPRAVRAAARPARRSRTARSRRGCSPAGTTRSTSRPEASARCSVLFAPENLRRAAVLIGALREVAAAHDATPAQVALAWMIHHPNVVAIPGASGVAQLEATRPRRTSSSPTRRNAVSCGPRRLSGLTQPAGKTPEVLALSEMSIADSIERVVGPNLPVAVEAYDGSRSVRATHPRCLSRARPGRSVAWSPHRGRARPWPRVRDRRARRRGRHLRGARRPRARPRREARAEEVAAIARLAGVAGIRPAPPPQERTSTAAALEGTATRTRSTTTTT